MDDESMPEDEFAPYLELLENSDVALILGAVRVVRFLDPEGGEHLFVKFDGDQALTNTIGMLEYAKQSYITDLPRST